MPKTSVPKQEPKSTTAELETRIRQLEAEIAERKQVIQSIRARMKEAGPQTLRPLNPAEAAAMDAINQRAMENDPAAIAEAAHKDALYRRAMESVSVLQQPPQPNQPPPSGAGGAWQPPAPTGGGRLGRFPR